MDRSRQLTYFISDLHLGADYLPSRREAELRVVRFLESIAPTARALYMLGDVLDYWYEYRTVVPRGYVRFFGALARLVDSGVKVVWLTGNHDIWLFDYLRSEIGIEVVDGSLDVSIGKQRFYLAHGDAVGKLSPSFRMIRSVFRNRWCQHLYAAVHPRWTVPFAHRWSSSSRGYKPEVVNTFSRQKFAPLIEWAEAFAASRPDLDYIMLGHYHVVADCKVSQRCRMLILGDWINQFSYAVYDGENVKIEHFASDGSDFNKT